MNVNHYRQTELGQELVGHSPDRMNELWSEFVQRLRDVGAPIDAKLRPPLPATEALRMLAEAGIEPTEELTTWYSLHDGSTPPDNGRWKGVFPFFIPHSLERALELRAKEWEGLGYEDWQWDPRWIRIAELANSLALRSSPGTPPLVRAVGDDTTTQGDTDPSQVVSLCTVLAWWIEEIDTGRAEFDTVERQWITHPRARPLERHITGMFA